MAAIHYQASELIFKSGGEMTCVSGTVVLNTLMVTLLLNALRAQVLNTIMLSEDLGPENNFGNSRPRS